MSAAAAEPSRLRRAGSRVFLSREFSVLLAFALLIAVTQIANPRFLVGQGIRDLLLNATIFVVMAVGEAIVVLTRNVDLSVGSILGLTAFGTGTVFAAFPGIPIPAVFLIGLVFGAILGAINGLLVTLARVPALVITLGTLYIYRGAGNAWAGSKQYFAGDNPPGFSDLAVASVGSIPLISIGALVVVLLAGIYLAMYRPGRDLYAIGSDPDAAELYGIPVTRRVVAAFVASGALAGLAGVLYASRFNSVGADTGTGFELQIVAAVVVGGVAIFGGSGTVAGAAIGAVLLTTMTGALAALNVSKFWQQAVVGALIIAAIVVDRVLALRTARRLRVAESTADAPVRGEARDG